MDPDPSLELSMKPGLEIQLWEPLALQTGFKARRLNEISRRGMLKEKRSSPKSVPWGRPTFLSQGEKEANKADGENVASEGRGGQEKVASVKPDWMRLKRELEESNLR